MIQFFSDFCPLRGYQPQATNTANPWILNGASLAEFALERFNSKFLNLVNGPCVAIKQGANLIISKAYFDGLDEYMRSYLKSSYTQLEIV